MPNVPQVPIKIDKWETIAAVDSGASVSIIDECFIRNLSATADTTSVPLVDTASGGLLSLVGCVALNVQIGWWTIQHKFHEMEGGSPGVMMLVFGNDFGRAAKLTMWSISLFWGWVPWSCPSPLPLSADEESCCEEFFIATINHLNGWLRRDNHGVTLVWETWFFLNKCPGNVLLKNIIRAQ